ncbi:LysR family transcriptional regulator [Nocardia transvalensis]|nr:LysR family transcriptional regulator [Nocardia transvalensis]
MEHFVAVAEEGSFTRAARRLHVVQSGISASVRALEKDLGIALFDRTTQRVELTDAGGVLLERARRILAEVRHARQAVDEVRQGLRGRLDLGILYGCSTVGVAALLAEFRHDHPHVEVRLHRPAHGTDDNLRRLRNGDLDLAFLMLTRRPVGILAHCLRTEPVLLACAPDHRLARHEAVSLTDLGDEAFIDFSPGWGVRAAADRAFTALGAERNTVFELNDNATVADLVRHRLGVALVPQFFAEQAPDLRYLSVVPTPPAYDIVLAAACDRPLGPVARAFHACVLDAYPPEAG